MSNHGARLRQMADYSYHRMRADNELAKADAACSIDARRAHLGLAELHSHAADERTQAWHSFE